MKLIIGLLFASSVFSSTLEFYGPCNDEPLFKVKSTKSFNSVGEFSVHYLDQEGIPYVGSDSHLQSVFNTPTGLDAIEVLSDTSMRSHGWIFSVNDVVPSVYPDKLELGPDDVVKWFYGYVEYENGVWGSEYLPTHLIKPGIFCHRLY